MPEFKEALKHGNIVEKIFLNRLRNKYPKSILIEGSFKDFDIYVPETNTKYEIKSDIKSNETGNYLIEVEHYGKPSALLTTKADYWIFYDEKNWVCTEPNKIKDLILLNGYKQVKTTGIGDIHYKLCYLVRKDDIESISKLASCESWEKIYEFF
jgi:hypothetical protein